MATVQENKELIEKYPFLLPRNVWSDEVAEDYDYTYTWLDDMPYGWREVYGLLICEDIVRCMGDMVKDYRFCDIKEKWGSLRIYDNGATGELHDQFHKYEYLTENTCITCGKIGVPMTNTGWMMPLCEDCYNKEAERKLKSGYYTKVCSYEDAMCEYDGDYKFDPILRVKTWRPGGEEEIKEIDCTDILRRIDPKYMTDEVRNIIGGR